MIEINVTGTQALRAKLERIGAVLTQQALDGTAVELEQYIEGEAATHHKTGRLVRSIYKARIPGGWTIGHDLQHAPHARFVVEGTRPHLIVPKPFPFPVWYQRKTTSGKVAPYLKSKRSLRWAAGGNFVFAGEVHHPGYKGDNYLKRAAALAPVVFERHVNQKLRSL